jgi:hypothetical protein
VQGQREGRRHVRRDGDVDENRRLRRGLRLRRCVPAADLRRRRGTGQHRPGHQLQGCLRRLEAQAVELRRRRGLRHPARPRGQPAHVPHRQGHPGPNVVGCRFRPELAVQGQGHRVRLADLHRRRRAVPDETPAGPGHQEPLRARRQAVRRGGRPAQEAERADRRVLVRLHQGGAGVQGRQLADRHHVAGHYEPEQGRRGTGGGDPARRGCHRLVRHLDDLGQGQAPELRLPVDEPHHLPGRERGRGRVVR